MKRIILLVTIIIGGSSLWLYQRPEDPKAELREYLQAHRYSQRHGLTPDQIKAMPKKDRPDLAWEQDFLATIDPALGRPAPERLIPVYESISQFLQQTQFTPGAISTPWVERGPNNVGGRVRAIMYDPNDPNHKKVWAGGVTGGLWYNNDITNPSSQWISVGDFWDNIAVTAIAYDPTNTNTFYVGTGE
ncbi:MAG: hypothetical protein LPK46_12140, partial [Bacteroidota bacterium]|nr:hypothetical protein [Bacteroidota bacterium]